jgi:hypothetical protein
MRERERKRIRSAYKIPVENLKGRDCLGYLRVEGRILLKRI